MRKNAKLKTSFHTQTHKMFSKTSKRAFKVGVILLSLFLLPIHTVKADYNDNIWKQNNLTGGGYGITGNDDGLKIKPDSVLINISQIDIDLSSAPINLKLETCLSTNGLWSGCVMYDNEGITTLTTLGWDNYTFTFEFYETASGTPIYFLMNEINDGIAIRAFPKVYNIDNVDTWLEQIAYNWDTSFTIYYGEPEPEPEPKLPICEMPENTAIQRIVGCMNIYTTSTSTPSETREWEIDIPMILFLFVYLLGAVSLGVFYIYIFMKKRK